MPLDKLGVNPEKKLFEPKTESGKTVLERLDELEILVRQNIQWNELVYQESKRTRRRLTMMAVGDWVRLCFWLIPFILGAIFLPPLYRQAKELYQHNVIEPQQKIEGQFNRALNSIHTFTQTVSSTIPH